MRKITAVILCVMHFSFLAAAEVTEVADAFDKNNPFDFNLRLLFNNEHHYSSVKREYNTHFNRESYQGDNGTYYATDQRRVESLEYSGNPETYFHRSLDIFGEFGLYHDLSLSVTIPIIFNDDYQLFPENGVMANGSFVPDQNSMINAELAPNEGATSYNHKGVGDIKIGLNWAPYNQQRNIDAFSMLLGLDVTFPTASIATPKGMNEMQNSTITSTGNMGKVGKGLYILDMKLAVSKRYEIAEPYMQYVFSLPVPSADSLYKNPQNIHTMNIGVEFIPWERKKNTQKVIIRTDFEFKYVGRGNSYNNITDLRWVYDDVDVNTNYEWDTTDSEKYRHILPIEDPYLQASFMLKPVFRVMKYVEFGGHLSFGYRQKHYLNNAAENEDGYIPGVDDEDTSYRDDNDENVRLGGGRLIDERHLIFSWGLNLAAYF